MNVKNRNPTSVDLEQRLSPHFTLGEMLRSGTAIQLNIDNMPGKNPSPFEPSYDDVIENLKALAVNVLEPQTTSRTSDHHERISLSTTQRGCWRGS